MQEYCKKAYFNVIVLLLQFIMLIHFKFNWNFYMNFYLDHVQRYKTWILKSNCRYVSYNQCFSLLREKVSLYIVFATSILYRNNGFFVEAATALTGNTCAANATCTLANTFCTTNTCQCLPTHFSASNKTSCVQSKY